MATKYGLSIATTFVKGNEGSTIESIKRRYDKDKLVSVASSLGWLVRNTLGVEVFRTCLNLVDSSPACGGGMERLEKAFQLNRLGPYKNGAINAAKISSKDFVSLMASHGLDSYGEPLPQAGEAAAAAAALGADSQEVMTTQARLTQGDSLLFTQKDEDLPGLALLDPDDPDPAFPASQGTAGGGGDDGVDGEAYAGSGDVVDGTKGKVSTPCVNDDHDRVGVVDDPVPDGDTGNVRAPAATDPLVQAGSTVGRTGAGQSQVQAGSQVQDPADFKRVQPKRRAVCASVRNNTFCKNLNCSKEHPPRCGDPRCFPRWRKSCQLWHDKELLRHQQGVQQQQQQQRQRQHQQGVQKQQQQQRHWQQQQQQQQQQQHRPPQGNGMRAGPGRAGSFKSQGQGQRQRQQQLQGRGQPQQQRQWGPQQQRQRRSPGQQQEGQDELPQGSWTWSRAPPPLFPPLPLPQQEQQQQQQQQERQLQQRGLDWHLPHGRVVPGLSYRDAARGGGDIAQLFPTLLGRLAALEERLAGLAGPCQPSPGMSRI